MDMISSQELNTLYWPYSDVESSLVKIGVVNTVIPLCSTEQTKNQKEALTCTGIELYRDLIFLNTFPPILTASFLINMIKNHFADLH